MAYNAAGWHDHVPNHYAAAATANIESSNALKGRSKNLNHSSWIQVDFNYPQQKWMSEGMSKMDYVYVVFFVSHHVKAIFQRFQGRSGACIPWATYEMSTVAHTISAWKERRISARMIITTYAVSCNVP